MKTKKTILRLMCLLFLAFIYLGFYDFLIHCIPIGRIDRTEAESYFKQIERQTDYINLYGLFSKLLGKKQIENFSIFVDNSGKMFAPKARKTENEIENEISLVRPIWYYLEKKDIPFLNISPPLRMNNKSNLPYGVEDYSLENATILHEELSSMNALAVPNATGLSEEEKFYRTDHHWSGDATFWAYNDIIQWIINRGIPCNNLAFTEDSFERISVSGFLGSYGIKVGQYYIGEDTFVFYKPKFSSDIEFQMCTADCQLSETYRGEWSEALINEEILRDVNYKNKLRADLRGNFGENRIINHGIESGKVLLISHSFGRPLAQYLALNFHEVRQIDPQKGRFDGNYITYIDEYRPDVVLFLIEFEGEIIGEYRTVD